FSRSGAHLYGPSAAGITTVCATLPPGDPDVRMTAIAPAATTPVTPRVSHSRRWWWFSSVAALRRIPHQPPGNPATSPADARARSDEDSGAPDRTPHPSSAKSELMPVGRSGDGAPISHCVLAARG